MQRYLNQPNQAISSSSSWEEDSTEVILAIEKGQLERLKFLVEVQGYPLQQNKDFHFVDIAICAGQLEVLKWLIEQNCSLILWDRSARRNGKDAGLLAIQYGKLEILQWLVAEGHCDLATMKQEYGLDPFMFAIEQAHLDIMDWLAANGLHLFTVKLNLERCLWSVVQYGHVDVLQWFVEKEWLPSTGLDDVFLNCLMKRIDTKTHCNILEWLISDEISYQLNIHNVTYQKKLLKLLYVMDMESLNQLFPFLLHQFKKSEQLHALYELLARRMRRHPNRAVAVLSLFAQGLEYCHNDIELFRQISQILLKTDSANFFVLLEEFIRDALESPLYAESPLLPPIVTILYDIVKDEGQHQAQAKLILAKLLITGVGFYVDNSTSNPLRHARFEQFAGFFSTIDETKMLLPLGFAIQAFYLLQDAEEDNVWASNLKRQLHEMFSSGSDSTDEDYSESTWNPLVRQYYQAYYIFKLSQTSAHVHHLSEATHNQVSSTLMKLQPTSFALHTRRREAGAVNMFTRRVPAGQREEAQESQVEQICNNLLAAGSAPTQIKLPIFHAMAMLLLNVQPQGFFNVLDKLIQDAQRSQDSDPLYDAIITVLFDAVYHDEVEQCWKVEAKIRLAELLLFGVEFAEILNGNPLDHDNLQQLDALHAKKWPAKPHMSLASAIQAFYLLHDIEDNEFAYRIKKQLHGILSFASPDQDSSEETWHPLVLQYYQAYYIFKKASIHAAPHVQGLLNATHQQVSLALAMEVQEAESSPPALQTQGLFQRKRPLDRDNGSNDDSNEPPSKRSRI